MPRDLEQKPRSHSPDRLGSVIHSDIPTKEMTMPVISSEKKCNQFGHAVKVNGWRSPVTPRLSLEY